MTTAEMPRSLTPDAPLPCQRADENPDDWFAWPGSERSNHAKTLCMECPLYWQCAEYALTEGIPYGVFGGMDERARQRAWTVQGGRPGKFDEDLAAARAVSNSERDAA